MIPAGRPCRVAVGLLSLALGAPAPGVAAATPHSATAFDADQALAASRATLGVRLGRHRFTTRDGREVSLRALAAGRPLVLSLIYTGCYHVCSVSTRHLGGAVRVAREALGDTFAVATVGFDSAADTPARMRAYARRQGVADVLDWAFLSGDAANIAALVKDVGFSYFRSPKGFDHLVQTTVVDAEGRVYRQIYGDAFQPPALVEPLKELVFGRAVDASAGSVEAWTNRLLLFCTLYDPASGRYRFDYSIFVGIGVGILVLGSLGGFLVRAWNENLRRSSHGSRG